MSEEGLKKTLAELVAIDSTSTRTNLPIIEVLERRLVARGFATAVQRYVDEAASRRRT